jgi:hypothetical protein
VGVGGKFEAAVAFRDDHAEEALVLDVGPDLGRQVLINLGGVPVIHHRAQRLAFLVEKGLLGGR